MNSFEQINLSKNCENQKQVLAALEAMLTRPENNKLSSIQKMEAYYLAEFILLKTGIIQTRLDFPSLDVTTQEFFRYIDAKRTVYRTQMFAIPVRHSIDPVTKETVDRTVDTLDASANRIIDTLETLHTDFELVQSNLSATIESVRTALSPVQGNEITIYSIEKVLSLILLCWALYRVQNKTTSLMVLMSFGMSHNLGSTFYQYAEGFSAVFKPLVPGGYRSMGPEEDPDNDPETGFWLSNMILLSMHKLFDVKTIAVEKFSLSLNKMKQFSTTVHFLKDFSILMKLLKELVDYVKHDVLGIPSGDPIIQTICEDIRDWIHQVNTELPEDVGLKIQQNAAYTLKIKSLYTKGCAIRTTLSKTEVPKELATGFTLTMSAVSRYHEHICNRTRMDSGRKRPICIFVYGPPGRGKSVFVDKLAFDLFKHKYPDHLWNATEQLYFRKVGNEYWEGYYNQHCVVYDDPFQVDIKEERTQVAEEILYACNDATYQLHMAALESKVGTFFTSEVIIISSNQSPDEVATNIAFGDKDALLRRFDIVVELDVHEQYLMESQKKGRKIKVVDDLKLAQEATVTQDVPTKHYLLKTNGKSYTYPGFLDLAIQQRKRYDSLPMAITQLLELSQKSKPRPTEVEAKNIDDGSGVFVTMMNTGKEKVWTSKPKINCYEDMRDGYAIVYLQFDKLFLNTNDRLKWPKKLVEISRREAEEADANPDAPKRFSDEFFDSIQMNKPIALKQTFTSVVDPELDQIMWNDAYQMFIYQCMLDFNLVFVDEDAHLIDVCRTTWEKTFAEQVEYQAHQLKRLERLKKAPRELKKEDILKFGSDLVNIQEGCRCLENSIIYIWYSETYGEPLYKNDFPHFISMFVEATKVMGLCELHEESSRVYHKFMKSSYFHDATRDAAIWPHMKINVGHEIKRITKVCTCGVIPAMIMGHSIRNRGEVLTQAGYLLMYEMAFRVGEQIGPCVDHGYSYGDPNFTTTLSKVREDNSWTLKPCEGENLQAQTPEGKAWIEDFKNALKGQSYKHYVKKTHKIELDDYIINDELSTPTGYVTQMGRSKPRDKYFVPRDPNPTWMQWATYKAIDSYEKVCNVAATPFIWALGPANIKDHLQLAYARKDAQALRDDVNKAMERAGTDDDGSKSRGQRWLDRDDATQAIVDRKYPFLSQIHGGSKVIYESELLRTKINEATAVVATSTISTKDWFAHKMTTIMNDHPWIKGMEFAAATLALIGIGYGIYQMMKEEGSITHGLQVSADPKTKKTKFVRTVREKTPVGKKTRVEEVYKTQMGDSATLTIIKHCILPNIGKLGWELIEDGETFQIHPIKVVFVNGTRALAPKHFFDARPEDCDKITLQTEKGVFTFQANDPNLHYTAIGVDLVIIEFPKKSLPAFKDIRAHFAKIDDPKIALDNVAVVRRDANINMTISGKGEYKETAKSYVHALDAEIVYTMDKYIKLEIETEPGDCVSPVVTFNPKIQQKIIGVVVGGNRRNGLCHLVDPSMLYEDDEDYKTMSGATIKDTLELPQNLTVLRTVPNSEMPRLQAKSAIHRSLISEDLPWDSSTVPAKLKPFEQDGVIISPIVEGMKKFTREEIVLSKEDEDLLKDCAQATIDDIPHGNYHGILSLHEAINGVPSWKHFTPIHFATSPGYPYVLDHKVGGKKSYFICSTCGMNPTCPCVLAGSYPNYKLVPEMQAEYDQLERDIIAGKEPEILFMDCLKDERRPPGKATRVYSANPFLFFLLSRRFYGPLVEAMMENPTGSISGLGINPNSMEWDMLLKHLSPWGDSTNYLPGDFKSFDALINQYLSNAAKITTDGWFERGLNRKLNALERLFHDFIWKATYNSVHIVMSVIYRSAPGSNPSGALLTTVYNIIVNSIAHKWCANKENQLKLTQGVKLVPISPWTYRIFFRFNAFGDDHVESTGETWYTFENKAFWMSKLGMIYTDVKKRPIQGLTYYKKKEVTYLKRSFDDETIPGTTLAPLELIVIQDIPHWIREGIDDKRIATTENCEASLKECFHHGRVVFESMRLTLSSLLSKRGCPPMQVPTFNQLFAEFRSGGFKTQSFLGKSRPVRFLPQKDIVIVHKEPTKTTQKRRYSTQSEAVDLGGIAEPPTTAVLPTTVHKEEVATEPVQEMNAGILPANPYQDQQLSRVLSREYVVHHFTWSGSNIVGDIIHGLDSPKALVELPYIKEVLINYKFFRAKTRFTFKINATPMHYGTLLVSYLPNYNPDLGPNKMHNIFQASNNPTVLISAGSQDPVSLELPFIAPTLWWDMDTQNATTGSYRGYFGALRIFVLNPLSLIGSVTTPNVDVTVFASFLEPEVAGLKYVTSSLTDRFEKLSVETPKPEAKVEKNPFAKKEPYVSQAGKKNRIDKTKEYIKESAQADEKLKRSENGTFSSKFEAASSLAIGLSVIPAIAPEMLAAAAAAEGLAKFSDAIGFSKPSSLQAPQRVQVQTPIELAFSKGLDNCLKLSMDPENRVANTYSLYGDPKDYDMIVNYVKLPGLVLIDSFDATKGSGDRVTTWPVAPWYSFTLPVAQVGGTFDCAMPTHGGFLASFFDWWSGSMNYTIIFCTSKFTTSRVRIVWVPGTTTPTADDIGGNVISMIVDITGTTEVKFCIPWLKNTLWANSSYPTGLAPTEDYQNGTLAIYVVNEARSMDSVSDTTIYYSIWQGCGADFQLARPTSTKYKYADLAQNGPLLASLPVNSAPAVTQKRRYTTQSGSMREKFEGAFPPLNPAVAIVYDKINMGEDIGRITELLSRWHLLKTINGVISGAGNTVTTETMATNVASTPGANCIAIGTDPVFAFMWYVFNFHRGSVRFAQIPTGYSSSAPTIPGSIMIHQYFSSQDNINLNANFPIEYSVGALDAVNLQFNIPQLEVPYYTPYLMSSNNFVNWPSVSNAPFANYQGFYSYFNSNGSSAQLRSQIVASVGDDFSMGCPTAPPGVWQ